MSSLTVIRSFSTAVFAVALCGGTALAAQNVANTSQKGSLLIFPLISVYDGEDTLIEISNDHFRSVKVECYYVNERKGRVDFDFRLTGKQTVSWSVGTREGDQVDVPRFPTHGNFSGGDPYPETNSYRGALICFATNDAVTAQIAFNHLTGTATVVRNNIATAETVVPENSSQAFRYNAWSFVARNAAGLPERNGVRQGTPGILHLTGDGAGTYDACPKYNIANFMPNRAQLGGLQTYANFLTVVSCNQDLRQDFDLHLTKLQFTVWNSREVSFTGAFICVDSVNSVFLGERQPYLVNGSNFEYETLRTANARFQVSGVPSTQCNRQGLPATQSSGLLGVLESNISGYQKVGSTTHGAGATPGFVKWDPFGPVERRR
jgi:hypothetical protein